MRQACCGPAGKLAHWEAGPCSTDAIAGLGEPRSVVPDKGGDPERLAFSEASTHDSGRRDSHPLRNRAFTTHFHGLLDFLLIDVDPLVDITNTGHVAAAIVGSVFLDHRGMS